MTRAKARRVYRYAVWIAAVVAVLSAFVFSKLSYRAEKDRNLSVRVAEMRSAVDGVDAMFEAMLRTFNAEAALMESFLDERKRTDAEISEYLETRTRWLSTSVDAMYINLYGAFGKKFLCGNYWRPPEGYDFTPRPWYAEAIKAKGETAFVPPYSPFDVPHQLLAVSRRLRHPEVVFAMDVELSAFEPIVSETLGGSGGYEFFLAPDGTVISPANSPVIDGDALKRVMDSIESAPSWFVSLDDDYVFHSHTRYGWRVVMVENKSNVDTPARWAMMSPVMWSILAFAFFFLVIEVLRYRVEIAETRYRRSSSRGNFAQYAVLFSATAAFVGTVWLGQRKILETEGRLAIAEAEASVSRAAAPFVAFVETARGAAGYCAKHIGRMLRSGADESAVAAEAKELIAIYRSQYGRNYRNIFVVRPGWYVDSIGWRMPKDYSPTDHDFYRMAIENPNENIYTHPYASAIDGTEEFSIARAVGDAEGTVVGIDISLKMLQTLVRNIRLDGALFAMTVSGDGYIVERHDIGADSEFRRTIDVRAIAAMSLKERGSFSFRDSYGRQLRAVSVELPIGGRVIVVGDDRMLNTTVSAYRGRTFAAMVVIFVVATFFVFVALRRIRRRREREIIREEREKSREENESLLSAVSNQCISVFDVDLKSGLYRIVKHPATTSVMDREDRRWDIALGRDFAAECIDGTRDTMERLGSVEFLRRELANADHREFHYHHKFAVGGTVERRCTVIALERNRYGAAVRALVTFMAVDSEAARLRQELEEALKRAESANQAKTSFFFNMSHDIRTPMNAIMGFTEIAKDNLADPKRIKDCLDKIDSSGKILLALINRVLNMSHIEEGRTEPEGSAAPGTDAPAKDVEVDHGKLKGKRILLVDDNPLNREVATYLLKAYGFEVDTAENGKDAVEKVRSKSEEGRSYDFVLMDIQMPEMNGYEATKQIREWEKEKLRVKSEEVRVVDGKNSSTLHSSLLPLHLPIIALSANAFAEDKQASLAAGMDDHIAKPVKISEILEVLAKFERK